MEENRTPETPAGTPTPAQLEQIGDYARRQLKPEEVYVFSLVLCDNLVDREYERFPRESLEKLAGLFLGRTGIFDHNPTGEGQTARIFATALEEDPAREAPAGEPYCALRAWAYMVRCPRNADLILEIEAGIKKEVSVGCAVARSVCSVCGADARQAPCAHQKGRTYSGQLCWQDLVEPLDAYEWSFVAVPAQRGAGVTKGAAPGGEAVRKGLRAVAITEHVPHSQNFDPRRMQWEEFPAYNAELDRLIEKYQDQIHVIKGFECEYYPFALENYKMFRDQYGYKLLILGHHTNKDRTADNFAPKGEAKMKQYADEVIEGLRTGLFTFLAHPDVPFCGYIGSADFALEQMGRIFAVCEELGIPVEINANGYRDGRAYPDRRVWELSRQYKLTWLINSDAHEVAHLCDEAGVGGTEAFARELGIPVTEWFDW